MASDKWNRIEIDLHGENQLEFDHNSQKSSCCRKLTPKPVVKILSCDKTKPHTDPMADVNSQPQQLDWEVTGKLDAGS